MVLYCKTIHILCSRFNPFDCLFLLHPLVLLLGYSGILEVCVRAMCILLFLTDESSYQLFGKSCDNRIVRMHVCVHALYCVLQSVCKHLYVIAALSPVASPPDQQGNETRGESVSVCEWKLWKLCINMDAGVDGNGVESIFICNTMSKVHSKSNVKSDILGAHIFSLCVCTFSILLDRTYFCCLSLTNQCFILYSNKLLLPSFDLPFHR